MSLLRTVKDFMAASMEREKHSKVCDKANDESKKTNACGAGCAFSACSWRRPPEELAMDDNAWHESGCILGHQSLNSSPMILDRRHHRRGDGVSIQIYRHSTESITRISGV